jgi:hypothetical protein
MSSIFEGIVCKTPVEEIKSVFDRIDIISSSLTLKIAKIDPYLSTIYCSSPRSKAIFTDEIDFVASQISIEINNTLLVRFDSRIGHRSSFLFKNGVPCQSFDENDELWVITDEEGESIINGQRFSLSELDDDEEYETICDAIDLGLEAIDVKSSKKALRDFIDLYQ